VLVGDGTGTALPPVSKEVRIASGVKTVDGGQVNG
jgi:hypothetical protein